MNTLSSPSDLTADVQNELSQGRPDGGLRNQLSQQQWAEAMPPFFHLNLNMKSWSLLEFEIAQKYLAANSTGWWYYSANRFVVQRNEDAILIKMWAKDEPFKGEIVPIS